jgi:hypothetical protein
VYSLEWFTNDPKEYHPLPQYLSDGTVRVVMTRQEWLQWRSQFAIGRPRQVEGASITAAELEGLGYVGLYRTVRSS